MTARFRLMLLLLACNLSSSTVLAQGTMVVPVPVHQVPVQQLVPEAPGPSSPSDDDTMPPVPVTAPAPALVRPAEKQADPLPKTDGAGGFQTSGSSLSDENDPACVCHEARREYNLGHFEKALALYSQYASRLEESQGVNGIDVANMLQNVGNCQSELNQFAQAEVSYNRTIAIFRDKNRLADMAETMTCLSNCYRDEKKNAEATATVAKAILILESMPAERKRLSQALFCLAYIYNRTGEEDKATDLYKKGLSILDQLGIEDKETAKILGNLGNSYARAHDYETAEAFDKRGLAILKRTVKLNNSATKNAIDNLAKVYQLEGKTEQEFGLYNDFLSEASTALGSNDPFVLDVVRSAGDKSMETALYLQAAQYYQRLVSVGDSKDSYVADLNSLSTALFKCGQYDKAEQICKKLIAVLSTSKTKPSKETTEQLSIAYQNYAKLLRGMKRDDEAQKIDALAAKP